jgi:hypothetical protein
MEPNLSPDPITSSQDAANVNTALQEGQTRSQRQIIAGIIIAGLIFVALIVLAVVFLMSDAGRTQQIRDIFIILMALESLLVGFVLVLLVVQLARLINLLQNEIKPILESTNETVSTLRGTTVFLSDHLTEPIIQLNGYLAALQRLVELLSLTRGKKNK